MFKTGLEIKSGQTVKADICIIGSGPAAFALALQFANQPEEQKPRKVVMLESSAPNYHLPSAYDIDQLNLGCDVEQLYRGKVAGLLEGRRPNYPTGSRLRTYGGTSNHWGGWSWPLEPHNLEPRGAIDVGWPIPFSELETYYQRTVTSVMRLPAAEFDNPQYWIDQLPDFELETMPLKGTPFKTRILQFQPIAFQRQFGNVIEASSHVDLYRNANALRLLTGSKGHHKEVHRLEVRSLNDQCIPEAPWFVEAKSYVIATGGIEATRILLLNELGNSKGQLGLTFMDHPYLWQAARFQLLRSSIPPGIFNFYFRSQSLPAPVGNSTLIAGLVPRPEFLQEAGIADFRILLGGFGNGFLNVNTEPIPDPRSRITLADPNEMPVDLFGQQRVKVDWQSHQEAQTRTMRTLIDVAGEVLGQLGYISQYKPTDPEYQSKLWPEWRNGQNFLVGPGLHPMGTTRMSDDPTCGVVDANLRVHDTSNLYVSASSVFPTGGYQNPTFTVCALSVRLADHLKTELA